MQRIDAVKFINNQFDDMSEKIDKTGYWHYGREELRDLMDFIYEGRPKREEEKIKGKP